MAVGPTCGNLVPPLTSTWSHKWALRYRECAGTLQLVRRTCKAGVNDTDTIAQVKAHFQFFILTPLSHVAASATHQRETC